MFEALAAAVHRHRWATLVAAGVLLGLALVQLAAGGQLTTGSIRGLETDRAQALADRVTGRPLATTFAVVFTAPQLDPEDAPFQAAMAQSLEGVRRLPAVAAVTTPQNSPPAISLTMVNDLTHSALALVTLRGSFKEALRAYPSVRARLSSPVLDIACTGPLPFVTDTNRILERDLLRAELISVPLALLVLLLVFHTVVAALVPVAVGGLAVACGVAGVLALSRVMDIAQYTVNVCSLLGLAVAIDYSLFIVSRYREELEAGLGGAEALRRAMAKAGRVVAFSGAAVATGLSGMFCFAGSYLSAVGLGGSLVVALAVLFSLTFLPALLAVLGPAIHLGRLPLGKLARVRWRWDRIAAWVMRRPASVLALTLGALVCLSLPARRLHIGAADVTSLPAGAESRRGYQQLSESFPEEAHNRTLIAVQFPGPALTPQRIDALYNLARRVRGLPHVSRVESLFPLPLSREAYERALIAPPADYAESLRAAERLLVRGPVALTYAETHLPSQSEAAREIVRGLRADRRVADGELLVGGGIADDVDSSDYIAARTPPAVACVVAATLVVLFLLLGSVLLPLKAVLMNVLSIGGSFGALVWIFQEGHLFVRTPRPIEPSLPILLFCAIFGLSMDYEVLMLSRIREAYERTGDNASSVGEGLGKTAGLITSSAVIMLAVFGAFALAQVVVVQAIGVGLALAIALDATLVRVLLVPATMRLFGKANWWAPRFLAELRSALHLTRFHSPR